MSIFKRGNVYWYKFMWNGEIIRESTRQGNDRKARQIEAAHKTRLAKQEDARKEASSRLSCSNVSLCDECERWFNAEEIHREESHIFCSGSCSAAWTKRHTRIPTLAQFLEQDFKPYVAAHFSTKHKTAQYYEYGVSLLLETGLGELPLNEISSQHAAGYIAKQSNRSPSTANCGLRTLRRALNLADEWGKIDEVRSCERGTPARARCDSGRVSDISRAVPPALARRGDRPLWHWDAARRSVQTALGARPVEWYRRSDSDCGGQNEGCAAIPANGPRSVCGPERSEIGAR
jgi:hypothetical protein